MISLQWKVTGWSVGEVRGLGRDTESLKLLCRERENALTRRKKQDVRTNHLVDVGN